MPADCLALEVTVRDIERPVDQRGETKARTGAELQHADAALYTGRQVIITPLAQTAPELVQKATDVFRSVLKPSTTTSSGKGQ